MNTPHTHKGFTLIEMMVSVALFAVVVSVALPTMIVVMKASARAQALQTTIDNTSFALDAISRQVRLGTTYHCTSDPINVTVWNATTSPSYPYGTPHDCITGASTLVFRDQNGVRQAYRYNSAEEKLESWHTKAGTWVDLTAPKVLVKNATFTVTGATIYDGEPPVVTLAVRGAARDEVSVPEFTLSTNMTQYVPERGFAIRRLAQGTANLTLTAGIEFGTDVAPVGDIDDDNVTDLLVGMSTFSAGVGGTQVLRMNKNGTIKASIRLTSNTNGMPTFAANEAVGSSVANLGDLDGDNMTEVLIGAPGYTSNTGAVYLTTLQASGIATSTIRIASNTNGMTTIPAGSQFGASLALVGSREVLVGAPGDSPTGCVNCGAVYRLMLRGQGQVTSVSKISTGLGLVAGNAFGSAGIAFLGYNTAGERLVAVGAAETACASGASCGALYILRLSSAGAVMGHSKLVSGTAGMPTLEAFSRFGKSVAAAGDLNGDGVADIIVGAEETGGAARTGSLYVLFMNSNNTVKEVRRMTNNSNGGPALRTGDAFGRAVANIGDLNDDGRIDFAAGARRDDGNGTLTDAGALYILFGK